MGGASRKAHAPAFGCRGMAAAPDPMLNVKRSDEDPRQAEKMRLLQELAKMTKPTGKSAEGKGEDE